MENQNIKVIVGLSGGVDSAVSCIRLLEEGYHVEAMFMRNWDSAINNDLRGNPDLLDDVCPQERDYHDCQKVCDKLGIKLHRVDFIDEYWNNVFQYFLDEYKKNRTPNPDVFCNKYIKFKSFLEKAQELGADYIAMGHYARVERRDGRSYLLRGVDKNKDQSYFLCQISQKQLSYSMFPVGDMVKADVRKLARKYGLDNVSEKKDSTGVCFIGERNFKEFLMNYLPANPGNIVDTNGVIRGRHDGVMYYTIGQRHGLKIGGPGEAWFVCGKRALTNELIVSQGDSATLLFANRVIVNELNFFNEPLQEGTRVSAKFRYRAPDVNVTIHIIDESTLEVITDVPVKAITPGQVCVFYDNEICLGGGIIDKVYMDDVEREY